MPATRLAWLTAGSLILSASLWVLPIQLQRPAPPEWQALFDWVRAEGCAPVQVWEGRIKSNSSARFYLEFGWWPVPASLQADAWAAHGTQAVLRVHHDDLHTLGMPPDETPVFRQGRLLVTRVAAYHPEVVYPPER